MSAEEAGRGVRETEFLRRYELAFQRFGVTTTVMYERSMRDMLREYVAAALREREAERDEARASRDAWKRDLYHAEARESALAATLTRVEGALRPFASGGSWGTWKAYLTHGPETKEHGIAAAKQITQWQVAADAALASPRAAGAP